jgi:hypothetical protein
MVASKSLPSEEVLDAVTSGVVKGAALPMPGDTKLYPPWPWMTGSRPDGPKELAKAKALILLACCESMIRRISKVRKESKRCIDTLLNEQNDKSMY